MDMPAFKDETTTTPKPRTRSPKQQAASRYAAAATDFDDLLEQIARTKAKLAEQEGKVAAAQAERDAALKALTGQA